MITKGKWFTSVHDDNADIVVRSVDKGYEPIVANCSVDALEVLTAEEIQANARLIAAAPKLLEACKALHSCLLAACSYPECADVAKHWRIDLGQAEAAIASAESQS